jgi:hypothetical protein
MTQIQVNIEDSGSDVLKIFLKKYCTCSTLKKIFEKILYPLYFFLLQYDFKVHATFENNSSSSQTSQNQRQIKKVVLKLPVPTTTHCKQLKRIPSLAAGGV